MYSKTALMIKPVVEKSFYLSLPLIILFSLFSVLILFNFRRFHPPLRRISSITPRFIFAGRRHFAFINRKFARQ